MLLFAAATASIARLLWWPYLTWVIAGAVGWSWAAAMVWAGWSIDQRVAFTALAAGAAALGAGSLLRLGRLGKEWSLPLGGLASVGLAGALLAGFTVGVQRDPYALGVAAGLALYAAGAGLAARPLGWAWLREGAAMLAVASGATVLYDRQPPVEQSAVSSVGAGLVGLLVALAVWVRRPGSPWLRPLALYASLASAGALALALTAWPDRGPLIVTLLVVGAESAAVGLTLRRPTPFYASPVLACAAWLLFATDALHGNPNWLTSPVGLTLLAIVELARWDRRLGNRLGNEMIGGNGLVVLEYAGVAFLVGASLVQTIFDTVWYGLLGVAFGVALVAWAVFTRVRRRGEVGAGVVLLSLFLMLTVPVVRFVPEFRGVALWGSVATIGILLLVLATTIEQSRARVVAGIRRLDELMAGWE
jgi:hypothetical protein